MIAILQKESELLGGCVVREKQFEMRVGCVDVGEETVGMYYLLGLMHHSFNIFMYFGHLYVFLFRPH